MMYICSRTTARSEGERGTAASTQTRFPPLLTTVSRQKLLGSDESNPLHTRARSQFSRSNPQQTYSEQQLAQLYNLRIRRENYDEKTRTFHRC